MCANSSDEVLIPGGHTPGGDLESLRAAGAVRGTPVALVIGQGVAGLAVDERSWPLALGPGDPGQLAQLVSSIDDEIRPRWVVWSAATPAALVGLGARVATAWDLEAVHRLLVGGWRADPARLWAALHDLSPDDIPVAGQLDLLSTGGEGGDFEDPVRPDGHLRPEWLEGAWSTDTARAARWAGVAVEAARLQERWLARLDVDPGRALMTARIESTTELLCTELEADGLPIDRSEAERIIAAAVGPRPADAAAATAMRSQRDREVLRHVTECDDLDLRSPADVKTLLRRAGIDVPDTRAWRLEHHRDDHPVVPALLAWRKSERIGTTFGYGWLDEHVGADDRLRGHWTASDGAAGRMTAQAGLHNMPAELRPAVVAGDGYRFVRADLGQIEPRVLAVVSGDDALRRAAEADDLYAPVARRLGVERSVAKIAVLAAMYGQRSGTAGQALRGMEQAYPRALAFLQAADDRARDGEDLRTVGGRLVRMGFGRDIEDPVASRAAAAARGRYGRNAMVQGAAAEFFKLWAVTVRSRLAGSRSRIVLCLHDELLVHAPVDVAEDVARTLDDALGESARRWQPGVQPVRFVAEIGIVERWSDAKA